MMTARGKLQRIRCSDISVIGRNTQGVRIMSFDDQDSLAVVVRVPREEEEDADAASEVPPIGSASVSDEIDNEADASPEEDSGEEA